MTQEETEGEDNLVSSLEPIETVRSENRIIKDHLKEKMIIL